MGLALKRDAGYVECPGMDDKMTLSPPTATSENSADEGNVFIAGPHRDYVLSEAVGWREGNTFILRSTEFDVMAEDEDFEAALDTFIARLADYGIMLGELVEAKEATPEEEEAFRTLSGRFLPLVRAVQEDQQKRRRRPRSRRRGSGSGHWRHRGTPASGSARLSAV
ncbi:MAG TPA: hypothetical protein VLJ80_15560 [Solirubrobacteraceae bacterium]|nr:hypothetical protein [Solirubrobacteraceae bacterium]